MLICVSCGLGVLKIIDRTHRTVKSLMVLAWLDWQSQANRFVDFATVIEQKILEENVSKELKAPALND